MSNKGRLSGRRPPPGQLPLLRLCRNEERNTRTEGGAGRENRTRVARQVAYLDDTVIDLAERFLCCLPQLSAEQREMTERFLLELQRSTASGGCTTGRTSSQS